jgi:hypothetical protein
MRINDEKRRTMKAKANRILRKMKLRRDQILKEFNSSTLDDVGPVGGDKGENFLKELNEMANVESRAGKRESPEG